MGEHVPLTYTIYGHTIACTPVLKERVQTAKTKYIDTILLDVESRFADMKRDSYWFRKTRISIQRRRVTFRKRDQFRQCDYQCVRTKVSYFSRASIQVLPFSTADCERAFSKMNAIKSKKMNRLGDILRALMIINCARAEDLKRLDFDDMAKTVAHSVWQDKKVQILGL